MHLFSVVLEEVLARVLGLDTLLDSIDLVIKPFGQFTQFSNLGEKKNAGASTHNVNVLPGSRNHSEGNVDPVSIIGSRETTFFFFPNKLVFIYFH